MDQFFKCHQCGKCCNSAPMLKISEVLTYSKNFVLAAHVKLFAVESIKDTVLREHCNKTLHRFNNGTQECFLKVSPIGYSYKSQKKCPQLQADSSCGIYENRPVACRIVPVSAGVPENLQFVHKEQSEIFTREGCLISHEKDGFTPIYENNQILQPYKDLRDSFLSESVIGKSVSDYFYKLTSEISPGLLVPVNNAHYTMNLIVYLACLFKYEILQSDQIKGILEDQIVVLEAIVNSALIRGNKDDRDQTKEFRNYIGMYKKALENYKENPLFNQPSF